jgi:hypothetical protein
LTARADEVREVRFRSRFAPAASHIRGKPYLDCAR